jgi:hypothetical protein
MPILPAVSTKIHAFSRGVSVLYRRAVRAISLPLGSRILAVIAFSTLALTLPPHMDSQTQQPLPIVPQPADMPPAAPNAPFTATIVTYQATGAASYSFKFFGGGSGKAMGYIENGTGNVPFLYDPVAQTLFPVTAPGTVYAFDGISIAGMANGRCYGGTFVDQTPSTITPTPVGSTFYTNYYSECVAIDNGVPVGTTGNDIFTKTFLTGGESFATLTGHSQTAFLPNAPLGAFGTLNACCTRARAIRGDEMVGDASIDLGTSAAIDSSPAANPYSSAVLWKGIFGQMTTIQLGTVPSIATATNGSQQGGWAGSHAVMWSGSAASMVDLNPGGYFDSRVSGMAAEFQVGDGWLGGPANTAGAVRHALLWRGSAASVVDLNQFLPPTISGAAVDGVDIDGNILGRAFYNTAGFPQEFGVYFRANPSMSLASFTISPANPAPGVTATGTVTLMAPAAAGGISVSFTSSNNTLMPAPASILIPEGQTTVSFNVPSSATTFLSAPAPITLTAETTLNSRSVTSNLTPGPAPDPLVSLVLPANVVAGDMVNVQVNLAAPAPAAGVLVNFLSSNPGLIPAPASLLIPAGQTSATVAVPSNSASLFQPVQMTMQAQTGTSLQQAAVTVASIPKIGAISLDPVNYQVTSVRGGASGAGFINLTNAGVAPTIVTLTSTNPALIVAGSLSIPAGYAATGFGFTALPVSTPTTGTLTATVNGSTLAVTTTVTVGPTPSIQSLRIPLVSNSQTWSSGDTLTGTIVLNSPAFLGGMSVALSTDSPSALQLPAAVTVPSLGTSVTFPVTALAVAAPTPLTITATAPGLPGVTVSATVIPGPALAFTSFTLSPWSMIGPGVTTNGTVTINQLAPSGGVTISLFANNTSPVKLAASVAIPAGKNTASFSIQGNSVSAATAVSLMANYGGPLAPLGVSATTILTVAPTDSLKEANKPTWSTSTHLLTVTATSTNAQSTITVLNANGNVPLGTMTILGGGNYSFQMTIASISSVNLKSNLGGSTGQGVVIVP